MEYYVSEDFDELYHYGVKGMKWGVRKDRKSSDFEKYAAQSRSKIRKNKDGSYTVPKGYIYNRVGGSSLDFNKAGGLYVSSGYGDAARYVKSLGPGVLGRLFNTASYNIQHLEVTGNIRKASDEQFMSLVLNYAKRNPDFIKEYSDSLYSLSYDSNPGRVFKPEDFSELLKNIGSKDSYRMSWTLSSMFGDPNCYKYTSEIYKEARKLGYDALPDFADVLSGTSESATIILNPDKVKIKETEYISKEVYKMGKSYVKDLDKLHPSDLVKI